MIISVINPKCQAAFVVKSATKVKEETQMKSADNGVRQQGEGVHGFEPSSRYTQFDIF